VTDEQALDAFHVLAQTEGILPALEPAHALAHVLDWKGDGDVLVGLSGRGDKDVATVADEMAK
jgi:tryptophan synthase beta chain